MDFSQSDRSACRATANKCPVLSQRAGDFIRETFSNYVVETNVPSNLVSVVSIFSYYICFFSFIFLYFFFVVNVILMSCLAGALRSYFHKCGIDHPDDVRVCLQVDIRPQHSKLRLDNCFSSIFVNLPSGTEGMSSIILCIYIKIECLTARNS